MTTLKELKIHHDDLVAENKDLEFELDQIYICAMTEVAIGGNEKKAIKKAKKKLRKILNANHYSFLT